MHFAIGGTFAARFAGARKEGQNQGGGEDYQCFFHNFTAYSANVMDFALLHSHQATVNANIMTGPEESSTKANQRKPELEASWLSVLGDEFDAPYFQLLKDFLVEERRNNIVYPPGHLIFNAFNSTPLPAVKAVILGQDPYHGPGQAHGLCFSVPRGVEPPPSLKNIFKELEADIGFRDPGHGNLEKWANEGVLLLNATLTVRKDLAGSHQGKGWENFTDAAIRAISEYRAGVVFLLWGKYAMAKQALIDTEKHLVLTAPHPSPLSASRGFFGCRHFSKTNEFLDKIGYGAIDWQL